MSRRSRAIRKKQRELHEKLLHKKHEINLKNTCENNMKIIINIQN
jgi:hypothetical protein